MSKFLATGLFVVSLCMALAGGTIALASEASPPVRSLSEMRQHNVVLQQWELSCAAAALATILRYQFGLPVTERSVALGLINRPEYIANPNLVRLRRGFSLADLKRYVERLGYDGVGLGKMAFSDLLQNAPIIVPVIFQGYPHFVVFRGATSRRVLLADPAFGNVTMSIAKFIDGWIKYKDLDQVGFVVKKAGALMPPNQLSARGMDFVFLR